MLPKDKHELIVTGVRFILAGLGENPDEGHFRETPERVAKMYGKILGGRYNDPPKLTTFAEAAYKGLVMTHHVPFYSFCAHHMLPFMGHFSLGYIPGNNTVLGLSKLVRIFRQGCMYLTTQEAVTQRAINGLYDALGDAVEGAMCYVNAEHSCMALRGVQAHGARTTTIAYRGVFETDTHLREQFLAEARK